MRIKQMLPGNDLERVIFLDGDYGNYFRIKQKDEYETLYIMLNNSYKPVKAIKITGEYLTEWLKGKLHRSDIVRVLDDEIYY